MAVDIERLYREGLVGIKPEAKHYDFLTRQLRELQAEVMLDFLDFDKYPKTETEVKDELARQADRYIKLSLNRHPKIKMARGKFKDSLIALARPQPENFGGKVDIPSAILGQVPPKDVYEAAGMDYNLDRLNVRDWPDDPRGYTTPQGLYLTWMDTGVFNLDKKVEDVRAILKVEMHDLRGAAEADGSGLYFAHPRILEHHFVDLPGTSVGLDRAPYLDLFGGRPRVHYFHWVGNAPPRWGSALCGREN